MSAQGEFRFLQMSVFARLGSIDLASCAPYEIMHLLFENLVPNMLLHWKGKFKWMGKGTGNYVLSAEQWADIGKRTAAATRTIPSTFVGTLPNIDTEARLYKAKANSFWMHYLAPTLLKDKLPNPYYDHMLLMHDIINLCLELEILSTQVNQLEDMIVRWVQQYEDLYYQHTAERLPTCVVTIHALLHIAFYIRRCGPLTYTWSFVMEHFCGYLLTPAVQNRIRPYEHMDNFIQWRAQMHIVSRVFSMPSLTKPMINYTHQHGEQLSSYKRMYDHLPHIILGTPIKKIGRMPEDAIAGQFTKYFGTMVGRRLSRNELQNRVDWTTLVSYGRFRFSGDGDKVRVAGAIAREPTSRDNSFVRYDLAVDIHTRNARDPEFIRVPHYGQVVGIYYVEFTFPGTEEKAGYILLRVKECNTQGLDAAKPEHGVVEYTTLSMPDVINAMTASACVGRVEVKDRTWAIIDRSSTTARTQFLDPEGEVEFD
ncbi:hypothetical protein FRC09_012286 [Ceratobasidium sp. 395]|nr:hypothetical protein FRC09_012286 [Ceratobasidium sp. 395]